VPDGITAKHTIPSPSVLFSNEQAEVFDKYYNGDFNEFLNDTIESYKRTVQHFYDLGCCYLQLDDTS
jgi:methionine synthase II (cobalamin-independent)